MTSGGWRDPAGIWDIEEQAHRNCSPADCAWKREHAGQDTDQGRTAGMGIDWTPQNVLKLGTLIGQADKLVELANGAGVTTLYDETGHRVPRENEAGPPEGVPDHDAADAAVIMAGKHPDPNSAAVSHLMAAADHWRAGNHHEAGGHLQAALDSWPDSVPAAGGGNRAALGFAAEMAQYAAAQGDWDVAAQTAAELGMGGVELSGLGDYASVAELANASYERETRRLAEDGEQLAARGEDRLARALSRIGTNSYTPRRVTMADLASPSATARTKAAARYRQEHADFATAVTGGEICGHVDELGRCGARFHEAGCSGLATTEIAEVLTAAGSYAELAAMPVTDATERTGWLEHDGSPLTWRGWLEAATGQRQGQDGFESGYGQPGAHQHPAAGGVRRPVRPGRACPGHRRRHLGGRRRDPRADGLRAPADRLRARAGAGNRVRRSPPGPAPTEAERRYDAYQAQATAESPRERAERVHQPTRPVQIEETWNGSLPKFQAGQL